MKPETSSFLKKTLPHDRSDFFSGERYWNAVEKFLAYELENDGNDVTSEIFLNAQGDQKKQEKKAQVFVICKEKKQGIFAGKEEIEFLLQKFFPEISFHWADNIADGKAIHPQQKIFWATGNASQLMKIERIFLNIISRMSGISTTTQHLTQQISEISGVKIAATRKTQWSYLDKKAVHIGGGLTHRMGLFDAIMLKENHQIISHYQLPIHTYLTSQGSSFSSEATATPRESLIHPEISPKFIEVEVESPGEFQEIFDIFWNTENPEKNAETPRSVSLPKVIMLDNFSPTEISETLKNIPEKKRRHQNNIFLEASGGITEKNISGYAKTQVDVVSMGSLTNNVTPIDFSMRAEKVVLKSN